MTEPLLRRRDVCRLLGICERTLSRLIARGRFPEPVRLTRRSPRWAPETVQAFITANTNK